MNSVRTFSRLLTPLSLSKICYFVKKYRFLLGNAHSTYVFLKNLRYYWNMNAINIFLYKSV